MRRIFAIGLLLTCLAGAQSADPQAKQDAGLAIGARIPEFEAVDQNGTARGLASIVGPKGAVLVFYRSADW